MKEVTDGFKKESLKCALITIIILLGLIVLISFCRKQSKTLLSNNSIDMSDIQERVIFDDIKIKINNDIFSHDQVNNEVRERDIISYFNKNLHKGDTIIYVSQDIGVQQLLMAKLISQSGRIYIFNPFEKYNNTIDLSAKSNGFESRIFTQTVAVSDKSFDGFLVYKNEVSPENGTIESSDYILKKGFQGLKVKVSTLDELCPNLQNIDFLRISTVKEVYNVLKGAKNIITHSPKIKIIADYDKDELLNDEMFEELKKSGFKIFAVKKDGELSENLSVITKGHIVIQKIVKDADK